MMLAGMDFEAVLGGDKGIPLVELPFDVKAEFGSAKPKVKVTVNGVELRTTVAVYGRKSYVGFRQEIREQAGVEMGDRIRVQIELDEAPREVSVPDDLAEALGAAGLRAAFDALAFTHRKEYVRWVEEAKRAETRDRRVSKAVEMLGDGIKHP
jgi:hypothetical protein